MGAQMTARSPLPFPTLGGKSSCPWHESCTPMDCDNFRRIPDPPSFITRVPATPEN